jgi:hypothetical protein
MTHARDPGRGRRKGMRKTGSILGLQYELGVEISDLEEQGWWSTTGVRTADQLTPEGSLVGASPRPAVAPGPPAELQRWEDEGGALP